MESMRERPFLPRRPALLAGVAVVMGCALADWLPAGRADVWVTLAGVALLVGAAMLARLRRLWPAALAAGVAMVLCMWGYAAVRAVPSPQSLVARYPDGAEMVRIRGVIVEGGDYTRRDPAAFEYPDQPAPEPDFPVGADPRRNVSYLLRADSLPDLGEDCSGYVKLYLPPENPAPLFHEVTVLGRLRTPRRAGNPGEVDSAKVYGRLGVHHTMTLNEPGQLVDQGEAGFEPKRWAFAIHEFVHERIGARMTHDRAAVLGACVLGERGTLSPQQRAQFVRSGTVHLLVVSGVHVAILAAAVVFLFRLFGRGPRFCWTMSALAALFYLFVTGMQPSVLRAVIMVLVYALGQILGRKPDALNVLGASALLGALIDPGAVIELGYQLSYLAVLGIVLVAPALRLRTPVAPAKRSAAGVALGWLWDSLKISLGVGLCTWPLLAYAVHMLSPIMLVSNLIAGPLVTLILLVSMAAPLAIIPGVGSLLAWPLGWLCGATTFVSAFFAAIPGGHLFVAAPPTWWLWGYYATLVSVFALPRMGLWRFSGAALWLFWTCVLPALALVGGEQPGPARVTALDVGQGVCAVIEVPTGPCMVVDCGSTSLGGVGERVLAPYLWKRGRQSIDVLVISHADADHVNGLPQLFERFPVGLVLISESLKDDETGRALRKWLEQRAKVKLFRRGDVFELADEVSVRCHWPDMAFASALIASGSVRNDTGLVLEIKLGKRRVLMPGDVEHRGFAGFVDQVGPIDVLYAPHQGSKVEGLDGLLVRMKPVHVVVSARETFVAEESMETYARSGAQLWNTFESGAVEFTIGADGSLVARPFIERAR
ncbi:ComE operon protein 3 [Planctomycetaceae bacterium]|nr:ComE operon protein 3 [Planctomycetaceae bacterium]